MKAQGHPRLRFSKADPAGNKGLTWLPKMETIRYLVGDQDEQVLLELPKSTLVTSLVAVVTEAAETDITADLALAGSEVFGAMDLDDHGAYYEMTSQVYLPDGGELEIVTSAGGTLTGIVDIMLSYVVVNELMNEADASVAAVRTESPRLTASEEALDFGIVEAEVTEELALVLGNTGTGLLTIDSIDLTDVDSVFEILELGDLDFPYELERDGELELTVAFTPDAEDTFSGAITVTADDPTLDGGELEITLAGEGVILMGSLETDPVGDLDFGNVIEGQTSDEDLELINTGDAALTITGMSFGGAGAAKFSRQLPAQLPLVIQPGAQNSFVARIRFSPTTAGAVAATLSIVHDGDNSPVVIDLAGIGDAAEAVLTTNPDTTIAWGERTTGGFYNENLALTNEGNIPLNVTGLTFGGTNAGDFSLVSGPSLPLAIQPGNFHNLTVRFTPGDLGARAGTLSIASNDAGSPKVITLTGTGTEP